MIYINIINNQKSLNLALHLNMKIKFNYFEKVKTKMDGCMEKLTNLKKFKMAFKVLDSTVNKKMYLLHKFSILFSVDLY